MAFGVTVVEVIGARVVEVDGLLDEPEPQHARVEVHVAARVAGDRRHVVNAEEWIQRAVSGTSPLPPPESKAGHATARANMRGYTRALGCASV